MENSEADKKPAFFDRYFLHESRRLVSLITQITFVTSLVVCAAGAMGTFAFTDCPCFPRPQLLMPKQSAPETPAEPEKYVEKIE